jgi:hypothetical protein
MGFNLSDPLDQARTGRVLPERDMSPHLVIVGGVSHKNSSKVVCVERDQIIRALAPERSDQAFSMSVLPRRAVRGRLVPDPHGAHPSLEGTAKCSVVVAVEIFGRRVPGKCFGELAGQPLRRRVTGHRKSQQLPPLMAKDETYEEPPKGNRRNDKEINRCSLLPMIAKETLPALQWPAQPRHHIERDRRLRDIDAQARLLGRLGVFRQRREKTPWAAAQTRTVSPLSPPRDIKFSRAFIPARGFARTA